MKNLKLAEVHFDISAADPQAHLYRVVCQINTPPSGGVVVSMATWTPGSYLVRDHARKVVKIEASSGEQPLTITALDKSSWQIESVAAPVEIEYWVLATDDSVRTTWLDHSRGFINGAALFLQVVGFEAQRHTFQLNAIAQFPEWEAATAAPALAVDGAGFGCYQVADYEELIDHPIILGPLRRIDFVVAEIPHALVFTGGVSVDEKRLQQDLTVLCERHRARFNGEPALQQYLFLLHVADEGYGGLEHRASTMLVCNREDLPSAAWSADERYHEFLGLCSHEYFHQWNVKRIRPAEFMPYALAGESYTTQLWIFEGVTSYFDDLTVYQAGLISQQELLLQFSKTATRVFRTPGRALQSLAEASYYAWTGLYKADAHTSNYGVSYYSRGAWVALGLDLLLRRDSAITLNDVMVELWEAFGKPGIGLPVGAFEELVQRLSGLDLSAFFARFVYGTEDPPMQQWLAEFAVKLHMRPALSLQDQGGPVSASSRLPSIDVGWQVKWQGDQCQLVKVVAKGPAQQQGLAPGDIVIAVNGQKLTVKWLARLLVESQPGDSWHCHVFRRSDLFEVHIPLNPPVADTAVLSIDPAADELAEQRLASWLER